MKNIIPISIGFLCDLGASDYLVLSLSKSLRMITKEDKCQFVLHAGFWIYFPSFTVLSLCKFSRSDITVLDNINDNSVLT